MYNMRTWMRRGKNNLKDLIMVLGPDVEQPYIDYVARGVGIEETDTITEEHIPSIARHMSFMEAGKPFPQDNWEEVFGALQAE